MLERKKSFVSKKREREDFFASLEGPRLRFLNNGLLRLGRVLDEIIIELKNLTWNRLIGKGVSQPFKNQKKFHFKFWSVNFTKFPAYKGPTELNGRHSDQSVIPAQSLIILLHRIVIRSGSQTPKITPSRNFIRHFLILKGVALTASFAKKWDFFSSSSFDRCPIKIGKNFRSG